MYSLIKKGILIIMLITLCPLVSAAENTKTYRQPRATWLEPDSGEILNQHDFMRELSKKQVVLLGEQHDIAEIHRWQMHTAALLYAHRPNMVMGFEMFPASSQPVLDRWVAGELTTEQFLEAVEWQKVWGFPPEIYLPLFHFCRQNNIRMVGLNCYRELVTRVGKEGWEAIPEAERDGLTPAAKALPGYAEFLQSMVGDAAPMGGMGVTERFIRAQQTWDRAFACNIAKAIEANGNDPLVIGIIGQGHLQYGFGTPYQLNDLGITDVAVLLPATEANWDAEKIRNIGDGIFRLDTVEQAAPRDGR